MNNSGSILATDLDGEENVHGKAITLEARDSVGSEVTTFTVEETGRHQTKIINTYLVDENGKSIFDGVVGLETAERYEDLAGAPAYSEVAVYVTDSKGNIVLATMTVKDLIDAYEAGGDALVTFGVVKNETNTQVAAAGRAEVRFDWIRTYDETEATELNVIAHNGDIYLTERTGDVGAGEIRASGNAVINVPTGSIATEADRSIAEIGGEMTVNAQGSVNLIAQGDLTLNLNTDANHVEITTDDTTGAGDITITSLSTDPLTGSALSNGSVEIRNGGDIGTTGDAFDIDTDAAHGGTAYIEGKNVYVSQAEGTLLVKGIIADGELQLTSGGSILDATETSTEDALSLVEEAQQALTEAENAVNEADLAVYNITWDEQPERAPAALEAAQAEMEAATAANEAAQEVLTQARAELAEATSEYRRLSGDRNASAEDTILALYRMNQAQATADEAAAEAKKAEDRLAAAKAELAAAEKDPYNALMAAKAEIEAARAEGEDEEKLVEMLDKAIEDFRKTSPNNGEYANQVFLKELEIEQAIAHGEDTTALEAELEKAKADTQAARDALAQAQTVRDHAAEALKIAEDALDAQVKAAVAGYALEDAETALRNANTDEERAQAEKDAAVATLQKNASEYLQTAEENLYDAYKAYTTLTDGGETDEVKLKAAEEALRVAEQAVIEARNTSALAYGTEAEQQLAKEVLDRLNKAVEANEILAQNPEDENAAVNAAMAADALAAAKQAADAAAAEQAARKAEAEAEQELNDAKAQADAAQTNLTNAEAAYNAAVAETQELMETKPGSRELTEARQKAADAYDALQNAKDAKAEADAAVPAAEQKLADARTTLAEAEQKAAAAEQVAKDAEAAADAKTAQDEAAAFLAETQNAPTGMSELLDEMSEAEKEAEEAQKAYDEAYREYLASNTNIIPAEEGAEDTDTRRDALDNAATRLENAKNEVARIADEIAAITGNNDVKDAEEALNEALHNNNVAQNNLVEALDKAAEDQAKAEQALADAKANGAKKDELLELEAIVAQTTLKHEQTEKASQNANKAAAKAKTAAEAAAKALEDARAAAEAQKAAANNKADQMKADRVQKAQDALDEATRTTTAANDTLAQSQETNGAIRSDVTGTSAVRSAAAASGGAAIRAAGNAVITSGGDVAGQNKNSLSAAIGGQLTVNANNNVNLTSADTLNINSVTAGNDVTVKANGDILSGSTEPAITGNKVDLNAVSTGGRTSVIGGADGQPMVMSANRAAMRADAIDTSFLGSVQLDDVVADIARIQAQKNITQTAGAVADVKDLSLIAGGDIGTPENPVTINTSVLTAKGENIYLKNLSRMLLVRDITGRNVDIDTDGSINTTDDGLVTAQNLKVYALGNIGSATKPMRLRVRGELDLATKMGQVWYTNAGDNWRWLIDDPTQTGLLGIWAPDAEISVIGTDELKAQTEDADDATKALWQMISEGKTVSDLVIGVNSEYENPCATEVYVHIDLKELNENYDGSLDGSTVYVMAAVAGKTICVKTSVDDGVAELKLDSMGMTEEDLFGYTQFAMVTEETFEQMQSEGSLADAEITEFEGIPGYLPKFPEKK